MAFRNVLQQLRQDEQSLYLTTQEVSYFVCLVCGPDQISYGTLSGMNNTGGSEGSMETQSCPFFGQSSHLCTAPVLCIWKQALISGSGRGARHYPSIPSQPLEQRHHLAAGADREADPADHQFMAGSLLSRFGAILPPIDLFLLISAPVHHLGDFKALLPAPANCPHSQPAKSGHRGTGDANGCCSTGASSGLHHDFHDNLYILLRGRKRFQLWSPDCALQMHTHGDISKVHPNGRIVYCGQVKGFVRLATTLLLHSVACYDVRNLGRTHSKQKKDMCKNFMDGETL